MKLLHILLTIFAIIGVIYIASYYRVPKHVNILQTDLAHFTFDMLREKQPIVVDDRIVSLTELEKIWFKPNITSHFRLEYADLWHKNRYKYSVLQAEQEGDIYMFPPTGHMKDGVPDPEESLLAVHLLPGQILIVPFRWKYYIPERMVVSAIAVHDYITYVLP